MIDGQCPIMRLCLQWHVVNPMGSREPDLQGDYRSSTTRDTKTERTMRPQILSDLLIREGILKQSRCLFEQDFVEKGPNKAAFQL